MFSRASMRSGTSVAAPQTLRRTRAPRPCAPSRPRRAARPPRSPSRSRARPCRAVRFTSASFTRPTSTTGSSSVSSPRVSVQPRAHADAERAVVRDVAERADPRRSDRRRRRRESRARPRPPTRQGSARTRSARADRARRRARPRARPPRAGARARGRSRTAPRRPLRGRGSRRRVSTSHGVPMLACEHLQVPADERRPRRTPARTRAARERRQPRGLAAHQRELARARLGRDVLALEHRPVQRREPAQRVQVRRAACVASL